MSGPKTVLLCSQTASTIGGVENWLDQLCAGLDASRWRPIVALVRGSKVHDPVRFKSAHLGLETVEIDGRGLSMEGRIRAVMRCVRHVDPAIFIPLVVSDAHEAAARLRTQRSRSKYLLTLHGNTAPQLLHAKELTAFADYSAAPGTLTCRLLGHFGMPNDRLKHIPNGARPPIVARIPRADGAPLRIGYVGRLTAGDKRVGDLVPLVHALNALGESFQLTIAGDGPERMALESILSAYPVQFLGAQTSEQLYRDVYPNLDVLLLFSESEAFGIVLVEALLNGVVPVSSTFVGCLSESIVEQDVTGLLFPVGDAMAAAACVSRLAREPRTIERLSETGQQRVSTRYSWPSCVQAWDEALQTCVALPSRTIRATQITRAMGGRLDGLGVTPAVADALRRVRRRLFGVPAAMHGGEEWPWAPRHGDPRKLDYMRQLRKSLDLPPEEFNA
jgi:glycosyltransferase involved in cell wall biosynthesis